MNRAEYIMAIVNFAYEENRIEPNEVVRILLEVNGMLNSGDKPEVIDEYKAMQTLHNYVAEKYDLQAKQS
jgi:hypothetical protein